MVHSHSQMPVPAHVSPARPAVTTVGELRASGHTYMTRQGRDPAATCWPGCARARTGSPASSASAQTVLPHLERALLAGHDVILLGERGQGKTRLIRTLTGLLDEWTPVVAGCEINDHPFAPVCARCRRLAAELGDELPVAWRHRERPVRREAGHPGHQRGRPDRRHRPGQGGRGPHPGRPGDDPLRPGAPHQPRRVLPQRAARPGRADPGVAAERAGGARHRRCAATRCGCRSTWCWWPAPTPRTTPTGAGSSPR